MQYHGYIDNDYNGSFVILMIIMAIVIIEMITKTNVNSYNTNGCNNFHY